MAATKYGLQKYEKVNGSWQLRESEYITDETPQPYTITFPENKSYADSEWKVQVQRYNDPTGCNSSGVTYVNIPSGDSCFCTCDNVSYFYHVNINDFPQSFGEGVTAKTFEIMTGYTQGCGTLSASTDSDLFENRQIVIGFDPVTEKYTFSATVRANSSTGVRTGRAYIYFKSYFEGGEYLDCSTQIDFEQSSDAITCERVASSITYSVSLGQCQHPTTALPCTIPYDIKTLPVSMTWRPESQQSWYSTLDYSYTAYDNNGWSISGDSCGRTNGIEIGKNMSTAVTRVINVTAIPYIQSMCDSQRGIIASGTPCDSLAYSFTVNQTPWSGCGCYQLISPVVELECDDYTQYHYGIGTWDYVSVVADYEEWYDCWTVDDIDREGEYIESGGSQVWWIDIEYVHENPTGYSFEKGCLWYDVRDLKNYGSDDWTARATIHWKGKGDNAGNTCITTVDFIKKTDPKCAPSDCDCEMYTSRVDKAVTVESTASSVANFGISTSSYYPCSYDITSIECLDESVGPWCNIVINQDGKSGWISATSTNNSCESRSHNFNMRLHTSGAVESCDYTLWVTQRGKCYASGCTGMYWSSGGSSSYCYTAYKTTGDTLHYIGEWRRIYACGDCLDACIHDGAFTLRTQDLPDWLDVRKNENELTFEPNANAGAQTGLTGTLKFNIGGQYCPDLDYVVNYDNICNCQYAAWTPSATTTGYNTTFPKTGGTQVVGKITDYESQSYLTPCIVVSATSTSQWDGSSGYVTSISIASNGEVSVTCRANDTNVLVPFTIDFNVFDDSSASPEHYCGDGYHTKIDCDLLGT